MQPLPVDFQQFDAGNLRRIPILISERVVVDVLLKFIHRPLQARPNQKRRFVSARGNFLQVQFNDLAVFNLKIARGFDIDIMGARIRAVRIFWVS